MRGGLWRRHTAVGKQRPRRGRVKAFVVMALVASGVVAAPRTLVVGAGECQSVELLTGLNDFSEALRAQVKTDLYESDVVLDIVRPRPTRSLEDVSRQVESARTLFYNGQTERALELLKQALVELDRAPTGQPWKVTAQALALQGVILLTNGKKTDGLESFRRLLRVEPAHALSADEFTPSVLTQFEALRKELARQRRSALVVQSNPPSAEVLLDGRVVGQTPMKLDLAAASYRLLVRQAERTSFLRVITTPRDAQVQIDLGAEGALTAQVPLCLAAKDKAAEAAGLKLANTVTADDLIVMRLEGGRGGPGQFVASRYEIRSGSMVREGRVQAPMKGKPAFPALATFLMTGQGSASLVAPVVAARVEPAPSPEPPVVVKVTPDPPPPAPAVSASSTLAPSGSASAPRVVSFVLMGLGATTAVVGVVLFAGGERDRALAATRQSSGKLPEPVDPMHRATLDAIARADFNQTLAFSLLGSGAGAALAGVLTFMLFPATHEVAVELTPTRDGAVLGLSGTF